MSIFLDSGDIEEIKRFMRMGIIRGVTTNPSILLKDGVKGGGEEIKKHGVEIARIIDPYPLSVEVTAADREGMLKEAREFAGLAKNINVKVTIHGPDGGLDNLEVVRLLETEEDIRVNVTAMMSAQQGLLAALSGATYVSLFGGRINDMGYDCREEIARLRNLLDDCELDSRIIVGSSREVLNVVEWLEAGAHIVTVAPRLLQGMLINPKTKETVQIFLDDARRIKGKQ